MTGSTIYLDAAATTPVRREVLEAMWPYLISAFGNASSHHSLGEQAAAALKDARERVAAVLHCRTGEVIFTSGGTESDNLAVKGIAFAQPRGRRIATAATEHEAVLACCEYLQRSAGFEPVFLPLDNTGRILLPEAASLLSSDFALLTAMLGNNEVGTVQPVQQLAELAHRNGVPMHTDAVQAAGSLSLDVRELQVDAMSLAGHKIGAPKGSGALFVRSRTPLEPLLHGGGQERGRRSGTENVAAAVGFATALELAEQERMQLAPRLTLLRDALIRGVLAAVPDAMLTGHPAERLPNNASFCFPDTNGEAMLLELERRGVLCSSGSACAAGSTEPSHVLLALGLAPEVARTAVRFTLARDTTAEQIEQTIAAVAASHAALRSLAFRPGAHA